MKILDAIELFQLLIFGEEKFNFYTCFFVGMVISYAKGAFMAWPGLAHGCMVGNYIHPVVSVIFIHIFVPESPVWLVSKGSIEEAARSLKFLYKNYPQ